jgi:hypothetical protein
MFFFFHLITGIILGLLLGDLLKDRRWIIPCVIGAVLPDLVDKPLGYIILPSVGYGRFFFHNLIIFAILLVAGLLLWKYYSSPVVLALDIGVLSHQILDSMWTDPRTWLYPLLGTPAAHIPPPDYLLYLLETDLYNPAEWVIILVCISGLVLYRSRGSLTTAAAHHKKKICFLLKCMEIVLWVFCGIILACGLLKVPLSDLAVKSADQYAITIIVITLAAILIIRWEAVLKRAPAEPENPRIAGGKPVLSPAVKGIERVEYLVKLVGKDPNRISLTEAKYFAIAYKSSDGRENRSLGNLTLALLGTIIAVTTLGGLILFACGKEIPGAMLALGAIAAGLLAGSRLMLKNTESAP